MTAAPGRRRADWRSRLVAAIEAHRHQPFAWGSNDCALFVADCIEAMTGADPAGAVRGRYDTEEGARAVLVALGHADVAALAAAALPEIPPGRARMGDVAIVEAAGQVSLGIFNGATIMVLAPSGVGSLAFTAARRAFRV